MKTVLTFVVAAALAACGGSKKNTNTGMPQGAGSVEPATGVGGSGAGSATGSGASDGAGSATSSGAGSASGSASGEASGGAQQAPLPAATIGGKTYKDLDKKGRAQLMKQFVLPKAKELFASFDPKFGEVTCKTCHGDGVEDHTFKMPNPKIKQLPGTEQGFMTWIKQNPEEAKWAGFMAQQLSPSVGQILGMQPFDPRTKTGDFSCGACHVMKK